MVEGGGGYDDVNRAYACCVGRVGRVGSWERHNGNFDYEKLHMMTSMVRATLILPVSSDVVRGVAPLLLFLLFLSAIFIWNRRGRTRRRHVVIRILTAPTGSATRPSLMTAEGETIAKTIDGIINGAGLGPIRVLLFQGKPTTDLIVETDEPDRTASLVETLLVGLPVAILNVGRPGDLRWHTKLWRHL